MGNRRSLLLFVLAIGFGLGAAFLARNVLRDQMLPPVSAGPVETSVVVLAKVDIPIANAIQESQLQTTVWPKEFIPDGAISNPSQLVGRVLRYPLARGEPIFESALLPIGSAAGLVSIIADKSRAVSVKVDATVGVAGFITPGTRVDVLATLQDRRQPHSKVVLQDIPVLAIDQRLEQAKDGEPELVNVVTLEVNSKQAEELIFASHNGRLQLALRGPSDHEIVKTSGVQVSDLIGTRVKRVASATGPVSQVEVLKGSGRSVRTF